MEFVTFKRAVAEQFAKMSSYPLFTADVSKDKLWETYLSSFPEGMNPLYRERTEHDCNCCKQFIRLVGNIVAIIDGKIVSIWDVELPCVKGYKDVAAALKEVVMQASINNKFFHYEKHAGTDKNFQQTLDGTLTWNHFFVNLPASTYLRGDQIDSKKGELRGTYDVMYRGLDELTLDAADTVLDLISQRSLYRGEEHKRAVEEFRVMKAVFDTLPEASRSIFVWNRVAKGEGLRIRNTAIGTLLTDISEGVALERAVASFESKVAPMNYKRPTALVTQRMIDDAKKTIEDLGLVSALERRFASVNDISVNNILFVDRNTKGKLKGGIFDELSGGIAVDVKTFAKVEEVGIDKFLSEILPRADALEVLFENRHNGNLASLIAPVDTTAGRLFKWDNGFSWSYVGDVTDSIKEKVKAAGGRVEGDLCCRLAWWNTDDLDFHMKEPTDYKIYFVNRRQLSTCGGMLDVDANGADGQRPDPVENIAYESSAQMKSGKYELMVHQYSRRDTTDVGFEVEVEFGGKKFNMVYDKVVRDGEFIKVADITYDSKTGSFAIETHLPSTQTSKNMWNLDTQCFHKVNVVMLSPNHWDEQAVGNRHLFFMIDECRNDGVARGIYNEFLRSDLEGHRKVFELVGSKVKTQESDDQLSGLGFSSTKRDDVLLKVISGAFSRVIKVVM